MAVQIVDARNSLLYFTSDLMVYAAEQNPPRPVMLIVNKADYLSEYQRRAWAETFEKLGIKFVYYSAKNEQEKLDTSSEETLKRAAAAVDPAEIEALADGVLLYIYIYAIICCLLRFMIIVLRLVFGVAAGH